MSAFGFGVEGDGLTEDRWNPVAYTLRYDVTNAGLILRPKLREAIW
jgi:hypothetical protein